MSRTQAVTEEAMLLSSLLNSSGLYTQAPQGDHDQMGGGSTSRVGRRRRRLKAKEGGEEEGMKKRRLSGEQVRMLEMSFGAERKLESGRKAHLASELGLDPKQVAVWFQNRRARWKSKQLEEEYGRLKAMHDDVLLQKCRLEAEVLKLKEQLSEAEKEIRKLSVSGGSDAISGCCERSSSSPSSSTFSMEAHQPAALLGGLGVGGSGEQELHYMQDYNSYINMMDWVNGHLFI
ncbi:hypothetical protein Taro_015238 [Colocasia esculenta]|uniref:Homeobox-leucine zipper protein n=1 Tax=Colocasia esculenta TaxID=4460 RepID=A0A843UGV0_COLES|nr:hypothetical protein [Colocasia esculenta]